MKRKFECKKLCLSVLMAAALAVTGVAPTTALTVNAEATQSATITSMDYKDGPTFTASGMNEASFGFQMPIFNGGANTWSEVVNDLSVNVKVNGKWVDIDSVDGFVYNSNWGHWSDSGFNGYWFKVSETTYLQLYSKSNPSVTLDYTLILNTTDAASVTALAPTASATISANRTGTGFVAFPNAIANGASYPTDADSLVVYVKGVNEADSKYVNIDNNAESGWVYNTNFGVEQYGYWFKVEDSGSINVKVALKGYENIYTVYTITYSDTARGSYKVYANGSTTITANSENGSCGVVFPYLGETNDNGLPTNKELDNFVIQFYNGSEWVEFSNSAVSGWYYQGNGYINYSSKNQWGYFDDYVYGLWFQPVTEDFKLRIGYPENGQAGGAVNNNYIEYQFVGAPDAYRPEDVEIDNITVGGAGSDANALDGWVLYYSDEFDGNALDMNSWSYNTGFLIDPSEPGTAGWGNNEKEYYTDSAENIFVSDGSLHLVAKYAPKTFTCTDAAQTKVVGDYASGKIISKDKVSFTYGRIDFRAKLPAGKGLWPALWLLPNDDTYGTWAASGEIDVMEARGRVTNSSSSTLHYGGAWPNNKYTGMDYIFPDGSTFDDGYHVYSCIWEEDNITFYVDGEFFEYIPKSQWYSANSSSDTAPFDQDFYIIMNLAVGGWFDGGVVPDSSFTSAEMAVDYVRVYKEEGTWEPTEVAITGLGLDQSSVRLNVGQTANLSKVYTPSNTTQRNVEWTSSNEAVATVSAGQVTAVGEGTALITATSTANSKLSASCLITVTKGENEVIVEPVEEEEPGETVEEDTFVPVNESGVHQNSDGTVTFYVKAEDTAFAPMVYYGVNLENPALYLMAGAAMNKDAAYGENYFTYTTNNACQNGDKISYLFSYTPVGEYGRIDTAINTVTLIKIDNGNTTGQDQDKENTEVVDDGTVTEEPKTSEGDKETEQTNTGSVTVSDAYGAFQNNDGTITFYVKAKDTSFAPMLYWGVNKTNPGLWQLGGVVLTKDASLGENYFSYTTAASYSASDVMNYMFSYTPVDANGRIDSEIFSTAVSAMTAPAAEEEEAEGEFGVKRNADGTLTFYIYANENEAAPLVFWGFDKTNPKLWQLSGAVMEKTGSKAGYYTYTVKAQGSTVSYMFGYTPLGESGRRDTSITTVSVK